MAAATAAALLCGPAKGQARYPEIAVNVPIEVQNDRNYSSDDPANEHNQLFTTTEPEITVTVFPGLTLFAHGVLEPVVDPGPGDSRAFEDHGLFVEDLYVDYQISVFGLRAGKFTPDFGIAWDAAPGVYGTDFAEGGYEFTERIGFGGRVTLGEKKTGTHTLSASTFFLDTSALAESTITGRGTIGWGDGGVSNTGDFSSTAFSLSGSDVVGQKGLHYHAAFIDQAHGVDGTADERGVALALGHKIVIFAGFDVSPLVEYVQFENADGARDRDRDFLTLAARFDWRRWNLSLSYTDRETRFADGTVADDFLFQASVGYAFDFGLEIDAGWRIAEEGGVGTETLGLLIAYAFAF